MSTEPWSAAPRSRPATFWGSPPPIADGSAKMLRQLQRLALVVRAEAGAIEDPGPFGHAFIDEATDDLAVLEDERHLARAHLEHGPRRLHAVGCMAEAGVEEAGIVDPELAHHRVEGHHLGREVGRHVHGLLRRKDVELVG